MTAAAALARPLVINEKEARRLLDPRHQSKAPRCSLSLATDDKCPVTRRQGQGWIEVGS
jgi:hypothetical protein